MPDDTAWPTQTFPLGDLGRLAPHTFTADDIFNYTNDHYEECRDNIFNISYWGIKNGSGQVLQNNVLYFMQKYVIAII